MGSRFKRVGSDAFVSAGVLLVVLATIMAMDIRVREQLRAAVISSSTIGDAGMRLREVGSVVIDAARTQSIEHAPMMLFVVAATVLLLFLVRT